MGVNIAELRLVIKELRAKLIGARLEKIHEPQKFRFTFQLWCRDSEKRTLLVDLSPDGSRIHLTKRKFENPKTPPRACQFLRSRLLGAVIEDVILLEPDRIVRINFSGPAGRFGLVFELFGPASNLFVLDSNGRIIFALRESLLRGRGLAAGDEYRTPDTGGLSPDAEVRFPVERGGSISYAMDEFYEREERKKLLERAKAKLNRELKRELKRLERAVEEHERNLELKSQADEVRKKAEALLTFAARVKKGASEVELPDPYEPQRTLTIQLDPSLTAYANADALFKKARKLARAAAVAESALAELRQRTDEIKEHYKRRLAELESMSADELARFLEAATAARGCPSGPREFVSADGLTILVGRNERENHELTFRIAKPDDLWLHVRGAAGSHVVVRCGKAEVPDQTLLDAANLALFFSSLRKTGEGEVMYVRRKYVRPVKGEQGKVLVSGERSIWIELDQERIARLKGSQKK